ncbi:hypothetical protein AaE_010080 [Aphanomyces astaci]|uniref:Trafficking protein particle complex subunit 13 N-terminal domain-containing protein n=1 Tax=Aphanomyces astaci TaxID=112090 RepID=A0A6A5AAI5_APHAT|nr:hypothetical protein AaE_010080 [Aphanomyces astaci]
MRLYKPRLSIEKSYRREFALSNMLLLPDSFGNIYLGETFSSYISVINQFACDLNQVGLTAKLQTPTTRSDLTDKRELRGGTTPPVNPAAVLSAGSNLDMAVEFELSEVGVHTLRVGVSYLDPLTNEPKSLRKFYRFQVLNPLTITFKHVLIQVRTHDFLRHFVISRRLEVNWKSAMGESGRLQTQPVMRKVGTNYIFLVGSVKEATVTVLLPTPVVAQVGQPFVASVLIQNNGTRAMNLQLQLRRDLIFL